MSAPGESAGGAGAGPATGIGPGGPPHTAFGNAADTSGAPRAGHGPAGPGGAPSLWQRLTRALGPGAERAAGGPGEGGAQVTVAGLMALAPTAPAPSAAPLAERPGSVPLRRLGQGHAIRDVRPFAEGDDPRHLDAAATARTGQPHVRRFHEDRERVVLLVADFRRPMLWGTRGRLRSVAAAEALAGLGWQEVAAGGAVGVAALTEAGVLAEPPAPGTRAMARVAAALAQAHDRALGLAAEAAAGAELAGPLARAARLAPRGALVALATGLDRPGEAFEATLAGILRRGPLHLMLVEDAFETAPPADPLPVPLPDGRIGRASFAGLPAARLQRAEALRRPGLSVERRAVTAPPAAPRAGRPRHPVDEESRP